MAINKKLIHFKTYEAYNREKEAGNILDKSIIFVKDAKKICTHDEEYNGDSYTKAEVDNSISALESTIADVRSEFAAGDTALENKINGVRDELSKEIRTNMDNLTQEDIRINNRFDNYQEKLTAGDGIRIENNTISSTLDTSLIRVVTALPTTGIEINKIYVVPNSGSDNNIYDEYIYANGSWEKVGSFSSNAVKEQIHIAVYTDPESNQTVDLAMIDNLISYSTGNKNLVLTVKENTNSEPIVYAYNPVLVKSNQGDYTIQIAVATFMFLIRFDLNTKIVVDTISAGTN